MVLLRNKIAEMKTGEGKTLVSTLPIALRALYGKGVHVVTVNDYLAKRDAEWMTPIYNFLGLDVGLIYANQKYEDKNDEQTLYFYIQGDGLCAILHLTMNHWNSLESVREKKAVGRRGAEFTNLKFNILQDSLSTEFIYLSYDRLID